MTDWQPTGEQSRAIYPHTEGFASHDGVQIFYEVYGRNGDEDETLIFVPGWMIVHSRMWKAQIAYFARSYRVIVYDPRGNGKSDHPHEASAYAEEANARDIGAVLDAAGIEQATLIGLSMGGARVLRYAADNPERVKGLVSIAPGTMLGEDRKSFRTIQERLFNLEGVADEQMPGINYFNAEAWRSNPRHLRSFLVAFFESFFEEHSTKLIEDGLGWALESDADALAASQLGLIAEDSDWHEICARVQCPTLVIHGTLDNIVRFPEGEAVAKELGTRLEVVESGHGLQARKPVQVNLAIREFLDPAFDRKPPLRTRRASGPKKALFISSPIGLGHAQRDIAIARELRQLVPGIEIDWLAQDPVTRVLASEGERLHPASRHLASESGHIEAESAEHDLHCFHAVRKMDEIMITNFMVFHDVMRDGDYDVVVGDESWEVDYYLHENPNEKRAPFVWLTDFVGYLPMEDGGDHEAFLTADYNDEMIGHIAAHPDVRDRAIFVGNPDDVVPERFGANLPMIREWTEAHYDFSGYITGFDPAKLGARDEMRNRFEYREDEKVCIVSVGGSGVGRALLEKVIAAYPEARRLDESLRMRVVAGPRIDPASLPQCEGLEILPYVHNLYEHLAVCDLAIVQGGLTTSMELTANQIPFLYFPLAHHFEQNFHVRHRLENYRAGRCMDFATSSSEDIARAVVQDLDRKVSYRPVETDGARRAAEYIVEVL